VGGISYGAGISLLGAAHDSRIKAVVSMSAWSDLVASMSAWSDPVASLYGDQTRHLQSAALLALVAALTGRPGPQLTTELGNFFADRDIDEVQAWARVRSAASYVDAINANHPAVLIANACGDTVFPPTSLVDFFGRLSTPKRLELAPGDHAVVEAGGLLGLPNTVWADATRWYDQYLSGVDTGIAPSVWLPSVKLLNAGEWVTGSRPALQVRGIATVHLRVSGSRGTAVAYLYDVDALGVAKLITHAPSTWTTAVGAIDVSLPATAYDVPSDPHVRRTVLGGRAIEIGTSK